MSDTDRVTLLCISSYFKGEAFLQEAQQQGCHVILLTEDKLANAPWPRESIDEFLTTPDLTNADWVMNTVTYLCRARQIDQIVPLDEYDVQMGAALREHLRLPGMGESATRFFRDKLAMRMRASAAGIAVPAFAPVFNYDRLRAYMEQVAPPWVLKPRTEAGAMGIRKIDSAEQLWRWLDQLGDRQSHFLLERYVPGDVFHVDALTWDGEVVFDSVQKYGQPPMNVAHEGGVFVTQSVDRNSPDVAALQALNADVLRALGMVRGVTHAEYIKAANGRLYFLEVAARVGGAHIADLIEQATGLNLWAEWARLIVADIRGQTYQLPPFRADYGGLLVCLSRQEYPDLSAYDDAEVVWRLHKQQHAGLIVASPAYDRVQALLAAYVPRFAGDFLAVAPPKDRPTA